MNLSVASTPTTIPGSAVPTAIKRIAFFSKRLNLSPLFRLGSDIICCDYWGVREWTNGTETKRWVWVGLELCDERDSSNAVTKRFNPQGEQM